MATILDKARIASAAIALALFACMLGLLCAIPAHADTITSPIKVSDDVTHFKLAKLDSADHSYVKGAQMVIINKQTQEVVASWTTGEGLFSLDKRLDVDTPYILREISAPDGYEVAKDTEFFVNASETEGITLVSGDDAELTAFYTISLYDRKTVSENEVTVTKTRTAANKTTAPKTGDETPLGIGIGIGVALLAAALILQSLKPRKSC